MSVNKSHLPRLLLEDYMSMLRGLVMLAWAAFILALITPLTIRASSVFAWPETGGFSLTYNAVLVEFGLNTLALTALLFYRDWYERVPRESAQRVRWLLIAVVIWFSLHLFAAFHVTGSLGSPLALLPPVLVIAALTFFPGLTGWLVAAYILTGHLAVVILEHCHVIGPQGMLSQHFSLHGPLSLWALAAVFFVLLVAVLIAITLYRWMYPSAARLNPVQRIDLETGLFRRVFLEHRVDMELGRIRRQGGGAALLLISLSKPEHSGAMPSLAAALIRQVRLGSDTPALYAPGVLAVLLPGAGPEAVKSASRRIVSGVSNAGGTAVQLRSAAAVTTAGAIPAGKLMGLAEKALQEARPGGDVVIATE